MRTIAAIALVLAFASCEKVPQEDLFAKAETHYLDQQYDEAIDLFKRFLLDHPNHSGAHFYLGTCYFASEDNRWLGIAQGELQTAIALFERQGKQCSIPRFNATYFELISHINLAKIYLGLVFTIVEEGPRLPGVDPRRAVEMALEKCEKQYQIVREIAPDNPDVAWLRDQIDTLRGALGMPRKPSSGPQPSQV